MICAPRPAAARTSSVTRARFCGALSVSAVWRAATVTVAISSSGYGRLLLRAAVERAAADQDGLGADADDAAAGEHRLEAGEGGVVEAAAVDRHHHRAVGDV